jgi:hypothetical protein
MTEDSLKSISDFDKYTKFIQNFILSNTTLWKLIFYPYSMPLSDERAIDPEDPYQIFSRELDNQGKILDSHGVVLFQDKDDDIQNSSNVTVLIYYNSTGLNSSHFVENQYITFQIICKGSVRKFSNGVDRAEAIGKLIDDEFNKANINKIDEIRRISFDKLNTNEGNSGRVAIYKVRGWISHLSENKNYLKRKYGSPDDK